MFTKLFSRQNLMAVLLRDKLFLREYLSKNSFFFSFFMQFQRKNHSRSCAYWKQTFTSSTSYFELNAKFHCQSFPLHQPCVCATNLLPCFLLTDKGGPPEQAPSPLPSQHSQSCFDETDARVLVYVRVNMLLWAWNKILMNQRHVKR